jgi:hypothetical protein
MLAVSTSTATPADVVAFCAADGDAMGALFTAPVALIRTFDPVDVTEDPCETVTVDVSFVLVIDTARAAPRLPSDGELAAIRDETSAVVVAEEVIDTAPPPAMLEFVTVVVAVELAWPYPTAIAKAVPLTVPVAATVWNDASDVAVVPTLTVPLAVTVEPVTETEALDCLSTTSAVNPRTTRTPRLGTWESALLMYWDASAWNVPRLS